MKEYNGVQDYPTTPQDSRMGRSGESLFVPGRNCWRRTSADRVSFLIDGAAYFSAFKDAAANAQRSILILSWDMNSRILLKRPDHHSELPNELGKFLTALISRKKDLHIYILNWDFSLIYAQEREIRPIFDVGLKSSGRFHFELDGTHPLGASHHQKIVVVDDKLAFIGGLDLTRSRWDTPEHRADDPRRADPSGLPYAPFHDIQALVDGPAAHYLGEIFRERWYYATGKRLDAVEVEGDPWPPQVLPEIEKIGVAIARTVPAYIEHPEVREIENLCLDMIASARQFIYIEHQYFTSARIGQALAARLPEKDGPEILLVLAKVNSGWLEENTMGVLRSRLLKKLQEADVHGHFAAYYPVVPGLANGSVNVHSKIMIVDDRFVRIGSANLSNRSMGLDTECDIAIEWENRLLVKEKIAELRNRLLGEHLGTFPDKIGEAIDRECSLLRAVRDFRGSGRTLEPMNPTVTPLYDLIIPESALFDPERRIEYEKLVEELVPQEHKERLDHPFLRGTLLMLILIALAALWKWTPIKDWVNITTLTSWAASFRENPMAPLIIVMGFVTGGLIMFPVTIMILVTAFSFQPLLAFLYALAGSVSSAAVGFGLGKLIGRNVVRHMVGFRLNQVSRSLSQRGLMAVVVVRVVPVLPFSVINIIAGASHIGFKDFILGTFIGMAPGILAMTVFEKTLEHSIRRPGLLHWFILAAVAALLIFSARFVGYWISRTRHMHFPLKKKKDEK